ncbi:MAG: MBL fold metallo-hydrolase [SAR202 cluster bacterium]|nr:MBL fold metallo-hydrolase [SAR202 cluster bacterium]
MIELTIIGTSSGGAGPAPGGACSCYLVRGPDSTILLDCGPAALSRLPLHVAPESVDAILLSHMHQDHVLDLMPYTRTLNRAGALKPGGPRVKLFPPPGGNAVLRTIAFAFAKPPEVLEGASEETKKLSTADLFSNMFDLAEYDPHGSLSFGGLDVSFVPMRHAGSACGMRITDGTSVLAYTGDTGDCPGLAELARDADILLSEASLREFDPDTSGRHGHLTPAEAGRVAAQAGVKRLLLTHMSRSEPEWCAEMVALASAEFDGPVEAVSPDDRYVLNG